MAAKYTTADYVFQFITVFAGVLLAILANTAVEWNNNNHLVIEARSMIRQELTANKKDLGDTIGAFARDKEDIANSITFSNELIKTGKTNVHSFNLHYNLADLSASAWHTAERTGALSHMKYEEVQKYSKLYDLQDLFIAQQRNILAQLSSSTAILSGGFDVDHPNIDDLKMFRERVMLLGGMVSITEDLASNLNKAYDETLK